MSEIYQPAEDSFFLNEFVKKEIENSVEKIKDNKIKILDMGSGSGIQAQACVDLEIPPKNITLVDINPVSVKFLKEKFPLSRVILSDLFSNLKNERFDLIIFNPPYLPNNKFDENFDTSGGKNGSELINKFLADSKKHLTKKGKILLLTSTFTKNVNWKNYNKKKLGEKKIFFEKLYVWELR